MYTPVDAEKIKNTDFGHRNIVYNATPKQQKTQQNTSVSQSP